MDEPSVLRKRAWKGEKGGYCNVAARAFRRDVWRTWEKLQAETVIISVGINAKGDVTKVIKEYTKV